MKQIKQNSERLLYHEIFLMIFFSYDNNFITKADLNFQTEVNIELKICILT